MEWIVQLSELNYDCEERDAALRVIQSEWLTMGGETVRFEKEFGKYINYDKPGVFVSSATAGLHLILMSLGISAGDEIIIPALTFVSDANVVVQLDAVPVLADSISLENFNVSISDIIAKITENTKAIIVVHFAGYPIDLTDLRQICDDNRIKLIEDCAHAPGASINGQKCGTSGHFSFFSFFSNKNLAVGEGGMVFAEEESFADLVRLKRSHGMSVATLQRHSGRASSYDVVSNGLNYRPDEIRAALGRVQLGKLDASNARRKILTQRYWEKLRDSCLTLPFENEASKVNASYHIFPTILPEIANRGSIMERMKEKGIQTSIHYPSFKSFSAYRKKTQSMNTPVADAICARELTLPLHPRMTFDDVDLVSDTIRDLIN